MKTNPNPAYKKAKPVSLSINFLTGEAKEFEPEPPPKNRTPRYEFRNGQWEPAKARK